MPLVLAIGAVRARRLRSPEQLGYLGFAVVPACLALNATAAFTTALRNVSLLIVVLPFVFAPRALLDTPSALAAASVEQALG